MRVLDCNGSGSNSGVIAGVDWVRLNHIAPAVANMSLGGGASSALDTAVNNLHNANVSIAVAAGFTAAFFFLSLALRTIPMGVAYAIWGGCGLTLIVIIGAVVFREIPDFGAVVGFALAGLGAPKPGAGEGPSSGASMHATPASVAATASASSGVADFPTPAEAALLELIPSQSRESCQPADPDERPIIQVVPPGEEPPPGQPRIIRAVVAAGIDCDLGGISAPDRVLYFEVIPNLPEDGDNAQVALARHGGIVGSTPGTCREARPASEAFAFGGSSGQLVCYETDEGDAVLLWVFDDAQLFGKAVREDRDVAALLDWWDEAGRFAVP